jgi:hypothetical protein
MSGLIAVLLLPDGTQIVCEDPDEAARLAHLWFVLAFGRPPAMRPPYVPPDDAPPRSSEAM